jgi:UDP-N-acetylmuramoyl-tripeptide--D-alanyl-D-alanine ligase
MEGEVIAAVGAVRWSGAALDSRRVEGGELFFALPGEVTDGHRFVADALRRGAAAVVVSQAVDVEGPRIRVADSLEALHALTRAMRLRAPRHLAAVTGSAGKTTTKELLAAMLGQRFLVGRSPGNLNNLYGFPLALLALDEEVDWMVAEMGMSVAGELARISRLGRPDVAVFTNVRPAHLESFGTVRAIAGAKAELLEGLEPDGLVVANADDPEVMWIAARHAGPVVTYGIESPEADVRAVDLGPLDPTGTRFTLIAGDGVEQRVELGLHGRYNVENCLAAAAAALALGVSVEEVADAASRSLPGPGRGEVLALSPGGVLVDDSYNSNPSALAQALEAAAALVGERHWVVLGDMLELGEEAASFHREAGRTAVAAGFDPVYGVGELSKAMVGAAARAGAETGWWATAAEAAAGLPAPRPGDVVLVKGSRGVGLERVVRRWRGGDGEES